MDDKLREALAVLWGEDRWKDSFYGEYVTEHDRKWCREEADKIIALFRAHGWRPPADPRIIKSDSDTTATTISVDLSKCAEGAPTPLPDSESIKPTGITYETLKDGIREALTQDWNNIGDGIKVVLEYLESLPLYVEVEIKKEWVEPISGLARNCHTGMHEYHIFIPYAYGTEYNLTCDVCGYAAAWRASQIALCDCCAQEWSAWNGRRGYLHKARRIQDVWQAEYEQFKAWIIKDWLPKVKPLEPTKHFVMERQFVPLSTIITDSTLSVI